MATTPLGERQTSEVAARRRVGPIIERFENLVAAGFTFHAAHKVLLCSPYLRDLPKLNDLERVLTLGTGVSPSPEGRRPDHDDAALERVTEASLIAAEDARRAAFTCEAITEGIVLLARDPAPTPGRRQRLAGLISLDPQARRDLTAAMQRRDRARDRERRAYGAPAARRWADNASRHRESEEGRSRFPRWWNSLRTKKPAHGAPMGLSVRFKEMGASAQAYALGGGAYNFNGQALAFSLNLDADTDAMAKRQANPAGWILARIRRELSAQKRPGEDDGLPAHVALILEVHASGLLHVHGFLGGLGLANAALITAALTRAGGSTYRGHRRQVNLKAQFDTGWTSYATKGLAKALPGMGNVRPIAYTETMRKAAEAFWVEVLGFIANPGTKVELGTAMPEHFEADEQQKHLSDERANEGKSTLIDTDFQEIAVCAQYVYGEALSPSSTYRGMTECTSHAYPATTSPTCSRHPTSSTSATSARPRSSRSGTRGTASL